MSLDSHNPIQVSQVPPGWYYAPGDPAGTHRRWDGHRWIGFPQEAITAETIQRDKAIAATHRTRLPRQVMLAPFGIVAALGLLVTLAFGFNAFLELVDMRPGLPNGPEGPRGAADMLAQPQAHTASRLFGMSILVSGVLFLIWLFRAHRNLGRPIRWSKAGFKSFYFLGWFITAVRLIFGPVISMMFDCVEHSGDGPERGKINPISTIFWWVLWLISVYLIPICLLIVHNGQIMITQTWAVAFMVLLAMHMVSLLIALKLVAQITIFQDRRL